MYKLLGSDQKEYGPVSTEQVRAWISQGRANGRSQLQAVGSTQWKSLAEFPEFADALRALAGAAPAAAAGSPTAPKTSGMALGSLVLGCLGLVSCGITSLVGLVLGIIALVRINKSKGELKGQALALAGIVVSLIILLIMPIITALTLPALAKAKSKAAALHCMSNVKQLNLALIMYANDNNEQLPAGSKWCDALGKYLGNSTNAVICPRGMADRRCHYALNASVAGRSMKEISSPARTVLVFECDGGWNLSGGRELFPATPRHTSAFVVSFADGHVEMLRPDRLSQLRWEP